MTTVITSSQNKVFKFFLTLRDNRTRKKEKTFLVEGLREIQAALNHNYKVTQVVFCEELLTKDEKSLLSKSSLDQVSSLCLSQNLMEKLLVRKNSGLLVLFEKKDSKDLITESPELYLILDGLEKPANLGAIFRTASAAGVSQIFLTNSKVDVYHPHVIRNSLGACFSVPCSTEDEETLFKKLSQKKISFYSSFLSEKSESYEKQDYTKPCALVLGSEDKGISNFWQENNTKKIIIPMTGPMDSLNVSVATGILLFEVKRQRL